MNNHDPYFYMYPTAGEIPAVNPPTTTPLTHSVVNPVTPMPPTFSPAAPPAAHNNMKTENTDFLLSSQQKAMIKAKNDIISILDLNCRCDKCQNGVLIVLSDLISELLTDQTVTNLSFHKVERAVKQLGDRIDHYAERIDRYLEGDRR